tara:strand:+ start:15727 stop:15861 length:135 start_codon:yes stop_codon:yes gene_type:complete
LEEWLEGKLTDEDIKQWDIIYEERVSTIRIKKVTVMEEINNIIV